MKKQRIKYEYRWKIKVEDFRAHKSWGFNCVTAIASFLPILKSHGFSSPVFFKIGTRRHLVKLEKKQQYGKKFIIAYLTRLNQKRLRNIKGDEIGYQGRKS